MSGISNVGGALSITLRDEPFVCHRVKIDTGSSKLKHVQQRVNPAVFSYGTRVGMTESEVSLCGSSYRTPAERGVPVLPVRATGGPHW
jgi:hypothetical protein